MMSAPIQVALACGRIVIETDQRAAMRALDLPTLILHGDADASIPLPFGRQSAQLVPGCTYIEYAGAPHGMFFTHRERIHRDVMHFVGAP
ncbi:MAG: non-heme chloroperoxidase [Myxococcales bacterium]|jgi:pimeloyl-ACP methyl ester carboxylesterase|nr:non-heme chloroperoxidase [Myxococcales bacterium]